MSNQKPRTGRNLMILIVVAVSIAAVFGFRFNQLSADSALASIRTEHERLGVPVETATVTRNDLATWTNLAGTVEGVTQYPIVSNNALRVVGLPVTEGMTVAKGDVIVRLADEAPNPMFHSTNRARASFENVQRDVQRLRNLFAEGAVSKQELDSAETALRVARTDLQDAEGSTVLVASQGGVVAAILVSMGDTADPNQPLVWITDTSEVIIKFDAGSNQALSLSEGQLAQWISLEGGSVDGVLSQLDLMADPKSHLLAGEATFANADGRFVPGLLVNFKVRTDHRPAVVSIPVASVNFKETGADVWVVSGNQGDTVAARRAVAVGLQTTDEVEIVMGLEPGEAVVLYGQTLVTDGGKVNPVGAAGGE